ncbi:hypothetical protein [Belliella aquatica]|uniref:Anti-sigma factor n=1 Tax=Belliella aquatica TaxID=1323734 RepID=A0ABQ1MPB4_9BACT|nr:hypothetical protein [Belliella aquatica]MCH7405920.1 hypothetical protein [Belliella aquatica]GGC44123.1 hypothetical protein GCM10010993_23300 [Belliella aquatica]
MKAQIENLLDKYWEGETSLVEEKILKQLLAASEGFESEKAFFLGIEEITALEEAPFSLQKKNPWIANWMSIAAGVILFLASGLAIYQYEKEKAERAAYQEVMQAFALINTHLEKGTNSMNVMEEFKHLNTTQELFETK